MKSLTGSLLGTAFALALLVPVQGAASQETCSEGSSNERVSCLVKLVTALRLEMQRGVADLTIESQRVEAKFDTDLRDAKRVIQESIAAQTTRVDGLEIQLGAGMEEVKGEIQTAVGNLRGEETKNALDTLAGSIKALSEDVRVLKNAAAAARDVQVTLREDIEGGVAGLTDNIEGILLEIQERETVFTTTVEGLDTRLEGLASSRRVGGVRFGSGGNADFGVGETLTLEVTPDSVVFITAEARVPPRSTEPFAVTPQSALHQKCDVASDGPRVGRRMTVSCIFGGLENGTITISGADPRGENSYRYFVLSPN